jgi:hypothetical protein
MQGEMLNKSVKVVSLSRTRVLDLMMRVAMACMFVGHGIYACSVKSEWIPLLTTFGFTDDTAIRLLPVIGVMDIIVAVTLLLYPFRAVMIWAFVWPFLAALSRPLAGAPIWDFVERAANWMLPLAFFLLKEEFAFFKQPAEE